jgi:hypothetical protein
VLLLLIVLGALPTGAEARKRRDAGATESPDDATLKAADRALSAARTALLSHDLAAAYQHAAESYRLAPSPEALLVLGRVALAENRPLEAQDLMRRYLADPDLETAADSPDQKEAQRIAEQPSLKSAKLGILGNRGTLVLVDGRLVGALPLSRPLLLSTSEHKVELLRGDRRLEDQVRVPAGRLGELRADLTTRALLLNVLPGVVVLDDYSGLFAQTERERLGQAVEDAVQAERLSPLSRELSLETAGEPEPGPCPDERRCLVGLAEKCEADYVLKVRAAKTAQRWELSMELFDIAVGDVAAKVEASCPDCSAEQAAKKLAALFAPLYTQASGRPRGQLEVLSEPPDAELLVDGQRVGRTPFSAAAWAGLRELRLRKEDYQDEARQITIGDGEKAKLSVRLQLLPEPVPPPLAAPPQVKLELKRQRRPIWRIVVGAAGIAAGLLLLGFGQSALSANGECLVPSAVPGGLCQTQLDTSKPAAGLLVSGGLLTIASVTLIAWPGPRRKVAAVATTSSGIGLTTFF